MLNQPNQLPEKEQTFGFQHSSQRHKLCYWDTCAWPVIEQCVLTHQILLSLASGHLASSTAGTGTEPAAAAPPPPPSPPPPPPSSTTPASSGGKKSSSGAASTALKQSILASKIGKKPTDLLTLEDLESILLTNKFMRERDASSSSPSYYASTQSSKSKSSPMNGSEGRIPGPSSAPRRRGMWLSPSRKCVRGAFQQHPDVERAFSRLTISY